MSDMINSLNDAVSVITPLVLTAEHAHMKGPWQMIMGGLILPEIVRLDPKVLDENPTYRELLEQYDRKKVEAFFTEKKVEVEKIVEKVVIKEVPGATTVTVPVTIPVTRDNVVVAEKIRYRRLKEDGV